MKARGEEANTNIMKLVKTDKELVDEMRQYVDAMVGKAAELRGRNLVVTISLDNGEQSGKVELVYFKVNKVMDEYKSAAMQKAQQAQGGPR